MFANFASKRKVDLFDRHGFRGISAGQSFSCPRCCNAAFDAVVQRDEGACSSFTAGMTRTLN